MKVTQTFKDFFDSEKSGVLLVGCTLVSLLVANSSVGDSYVHFWHTSLGMLHIEQWINDALMAIFFLMIGLELKRELYVGELSSAKTGLLPVFAAVGGMLVPALIYGGLNWNHTTANGFGIPMATDIAFAIGILSLLGNRVPASLKVFLTAVAVIDDLGAILVIAFFYTSNLSLMYLSLVLIFWVVLLLLSKWKVRWLLIYVLLGAAMWYFMLQSGVHATLSGILLAFALPFEKGSRQALSYKVQKGLHKPVSLLILPVFALANTAIVFGQGWDKGLMSAASLGIIIGLVIGKPVGIFLLSFFSVKSRIAVLPGDLKWSQVLGAGLLAGIGFTMSIFITLLAFGDDYLITESKISILLGSLVSGILGYAYLNHLLRPANKNSINKRS